ncbi:MAG: hypothetical protein KDJ41_12260 [Hyphomicrobiaceae bacterium]|nr:hypothetical protein [Hyphomicrobiaceae bacterium]
MVAFKDLWRNHPINQSNQSPCIVPKDMKVFGKDMRRGMPTFSNQCSIRMGVALKNAGVSPGAVRGCVTCGVHGPEAMHFIRARELANALVAANIPNVAKVERITGPEVQKFYPRLIGRTGIIFFNGYWYRNAQERAARNPTGDHIDVWNGYRTSAKWLLEWFSWLGYYSNYASGKEIWFWEVK